jgi:hypothetical protein
VSEKILLGFSVPDGEPVYLPLHHLAIFGMTQLSGKTTTLEALISRSGLRAIAFIVKRGEAGFTKYNLVTPYYKPRADWQFVEGLVNVALGEKVKYEPGMRYAIMKVCKGRKDLKEIQKAAIDLAHQTKREFMKSVYEKLAAYLDIVIPELERWIFTDKLELSEGVNVMDLSEMRTETQHLVIASTIEYAFQNLDHVVVIVPEAWETLPQTKMTPVKWVAQQFIRKGAAIGNYLWLDSQDIGGIDKTPLRQCDNWLMGRMKEAHEVERILKQLLGMKVPAEEIQTLPLGHFYAAIGNEVRKVYVLPAGVPEPVGVEVARGIRTPESVRDEYLKPKLVEVDQELVWKEKYEQLKKEFEEWKGMLENEIIKGVKERTKELENQFEEERKKRVAAENELLILKKKLETFEVFKKQAEEKVKLEEELKKLEPLKAFAEALTKFLAECSNVRVAGFEPAQVDLEHRQLVVNVHHAGDKTVKVSTDSVVGQILYCAVKYFKDREFATGELNEKLLEHGWNIKPSTLSAKLSLLTNEGKLVKTDKGYRLPGMVRFEVKGEVENAV